MILTVLLLSMQIASAAPAKSKVAAAEPPYEHLRIRNAFLQPDEVIRYYCARDASGFVWSGMLDGERKAFTLWENAPSSDTFLIAKRYHIGPSRSIAGQKDVARVEVSYDLLAIGDIHGARADPPRNPYVVDFQLKKTGGIWKIEKPDPAEIAPVVLQNQFP